MDFSIPHSLNERLWIEPGEGKVGPVATVALIAPVDKLYSYAVPDSLASAIKTGQRIRVPTGRRGALRVGFCVAVDRRPWDSTLREVHSTVDQASFLTADLLELGGWISRYYSSPLGRTLAALMPEAVRKQAGFVTLRHVELTVEGRNTDFHPQPTRRVVALLNALRDADRPLEATQLLAKTEVTASTLRTAIKHGWVRIIISKAPASAPRFDAELREPDFSLNPDQVAAFQHIDARLNSGGFDVSLLHGVTGSGKTEVYVRAMRRAVEMGRQAILLVPEIILTAQLMQRLAVRFANPAMIHSGLSAVARSLLWQEVASGQRAVVIGTRSAVFAPCPRLGLIIVDEEQESSYKNPRAPRYHVREVALKRAHLLNIPVVLGSATPSIETWHNCLRFSHFHRIELPHRVRDLPMPKVEVVNMEDEARTIGPKAVFSRTFADYLSHTLKRGEQALVLINRRGFATWLYCPACKLLLRCPNCSTNLVYHVTDRTVVCHHCRYRTPAPRLCPDPSCQSPLVKRGSGSQKIETALQSQWPDARIVRVDSDTMRHRSHYETTVADFEQRRVDVLVGTQMIAKGLDFPFVSFVGVIGADRSTGAADFRSGERLFQIISQVAGRAGRGDTGGIVVVQTSEPHLPALNAALRHDYNAFVSDELEFRRRFDYPPFRRLIRFIVADSSPERGQSSAQALAVRIREELPKIERPVETLHGPIPCVLERLRGRYRFDLLLRVDSATEVERVMTHLRGTKALRCKAESLVVDVDPIALT